MIQHKGRGTEQCQPHGQEHPVGQLMPAGGLHSVERGSRHKSPGPEDVDLMRPDSTDLVTSERENDNEEQGGGHEWAAL